LWEQVWHPCQPNPPQMSSTTNYCRGEKGSLVQALRTRETKKKDVKYIRSKRTTRVITKNAVKVPIKYPKL